jgi:voltage-gated potassium channel Kch
VGQIVTQSALLRGAEITLIDRDTTTIRFAEKYGFKVYYGDGARPEVLHAAGAHHARAIIVCVDDRAAATLIAQTAKQHFPQAELIVRAYDREHALALVKTDADVVVRETFESALVLGRATARALGASDSEADEDIAELRRRDAERFALETSGGWFAGRDLVLRNMGEPPAAPVAGAGATLR